MVEDVAIFDQKMFKLCTKTEIYSFKVSVVHSLFAVIPST